ncbi:hypothetical protein Bpfe_029713 [Biomphalaria pfeifferi]|uniref:MYND-type domain-containing protein n=1 Tax=Biomphalaria pfeifferi TaxID=112525 RepID=A0AAD8AR10_BIOPF|nr:hypothetical protein Bpfe_029713 [Biomphalaria pfeifferi]
MDCLNLSMTNEDFTAGHFIAPSLDKFYFYNLDIDSDDEDDIISEDSHFVSTGTEHNGAQNRVHSENFNLRTVTPDNIERIVVYPQVEDSEYTNQCIHDTLNSSEVQAREEIFYVEPTKTLNDNDKARISCDLKQEKEQNDVDNYRNDSGPLPDHLNDERRLHPVYEYDAAKSDRCHLIDVSHDHFITQDVDGDDLDTGLSRIEGTTEARSTSSVTYSISCPSNDPTKGDSEVKLDETKSTSKSTLRSNTHEEDTFISPENTQAAQNYNYPSLGQEIREVIGTSIPCDNLETTRLKYRSDYPEFISKDTQEFSTDKGRTTLVSNTEDIRCMYSVSSKLVSQELCTQIYDTSDSDSSDDIPNASALIEHKPYFLECGVDNDSENELLVNESLNGVVKEEIHERTSCQDTFASVFESNLLEKENITVFLKPDSNDVPLQARDTALSSAPKERAPIQVLDTVQVQEGHEKDSENKCLLSLTNKQALLSSGLTNENSEISASYMVVSTLTAIKEIEAGQISETKETSTAEISSHKILHVTSSTLLETSSSKEVSKSDIQETLSSETDGVVTQVSFNNLEPKCISTSAFIHSLRLESNRKNIESTKIKDLDADKVSRKSEKHQERIASTQLYYCDSDEETNLGDSAVQDKHYFLNCSVDSDHEDTLIDGVETGTLNLETYMAATPPTQELAGGDNKSRAQLETSASILESLETPKANEVNHLELEEMPMTVAAPEAEMMSTLQRYEIIDADPTEITKPYVLTPTSESKEITITPSKSEIKLIFLKEIPASKCEQIPSDSKEITVEKEILIMKSEEIIVEKEITAKETEEITIEKEIPVLTKESEEITVDKEIPTKGTKEITVKKEILIKELEEIQYIVEKEILTKESEEITVEKELPIKELEDITVQREIGLLTKESEVNAVVFPPEQTVKQVRNLEETLRSVLEDISILDVNLETEKLSETKTVSNTTRNKRTVCHSSEFDLENVSSKTNLKLMNCIYDRDTSDESDLSLPIMSDQKYFLDCSVDSDDGDDFIIKAEPADEFVTSEAINVTFTKVNEIPFTKAADVVFTQSTNVIFTEARHESITVEKEIPTNEHEEISVEKEIPPKQTVKKVRNLEEKQLSEVILSLETKEMLLYEAKETQALETTKILSLESKETELFETKDLDQLITTRSQSFATEDLPSSELTEPLTYFHDSDFNDQSNNCPITMLHKSYFLDCSVDSDDQDCLQNSCVINSDKVQGPDSYNLELLLQRESQNLELNISEAIITSTLEITQVQSSKTEDVYVSASKDVQTSVEADIETFVETDVQTSVDKDVQTSVDKSVQTSEDKDVQISVDKDVRTSVDKDVQTSYLTTEFATNATQVSVGYPSSSETATLISNSITSPDIFLPQSKDSFTDVVSSVSSPISTSNTDHLSLQDNRLIHDAVENVNSTFSVTDSKEILKGNSIPECNHYLEHGVSLSEATCEESNNKRTTESYSKTKDSMIQLNSAEVSENEQYINSLDFYDTNSEEELSTVMPVLPQKSYFLDCGIDSDNDETLNIIIGNEKCKVVDESSTTSTFREFFLKDSQKISTVKKDAIRENKDSKINEGSSVDYYAKQESLALKAKNLNVISSDNEMSMFKSYEANELQINSNPEHGVIVSEPNDVFTFNHNKGAFVESKCTNVQNTDDSIFHQSPEIRVCTKDIVLPETEVSIISQTLLSEMNDLSCNLSSNVSSLATQGSATQLVQKNRIKSHTEQTDLNLRGSDAEVMPNNIQQKDKETVSALTNSDNNALNEMPINNLSPNHDLKASATEMKAEESMSFCTLFYQSDSEDEETQDDRFVNFVSKPYFVNCAIDSDDELDLENCRKNISLCAWTLTDNDSLDIVSNHGQGISSMSEDVDTSLEEIQHSECIDFNRKTNIRTNLRTQNKNSEETETIKGAYTSDPHRTPYNEAGDDTHKASDNEADDNSSSSAVESRCSSSYIEEDLFNSATCFVPHESEESAEAFQNQMNTPSQASLVPFNPGACSPAAAQRHHMEDLAYDDDDTSDPWAGKGLCLLCRKQSDNLMYCTFCYTVKYCSEKCRRKDETNHAETCERFERFQEMKNAAESMTNHSNNQLVCHFHKMPHKDKSQSAVSVLAEIIKIHSNSRHYLLTLQDASGKTTGLKISKNAEKHINRFNGLGLPIELSDYLKEGNFVLLNSPFWHRSSCHLELVDQRDIQIIPSPENRFDVESFMDEMF